MLWRGSTRTSPLRAPSVSIPKPAALFTFRRHFRAAAGARCTIATDRTQLFASTTATRITRRWKQAKGKGRYSSPIESCAKIQAVRANSAADWAWRKKYECSRRPACNPRWSGRFARRGDCTAVKTRMANRFSIVRKDGSVQRLPTGKTAGHVALEAGDGFLVEVGGGGGFWNPLERDPARVLDDVRSGYVSLEAAAARLRRGDSAKWAEVRARCGSDSGIETSARLSGSLFLPEELGRGEKISIGVMLSTAKHLAFQGRRRDPSPIGSG